MTLEKAQPKPSQRRKERAVRRLFVTLDRAIRATEAAREARDELVRLGQRKTESKSQ